MKTKHILTFAPDLFSVNDSMEVESGTELARLDTGDTVVTLEVRGDVDVEYKGKSYRSPAKFPPELLEIMHNGYDSDESGTLNVIDNNWAEVFCWEKKDGGKLSWTGQSDVVDLEFDNPSDIYSFLLDCATIFEERIKEA